MTESRVPQSMHPSSLETYKFIAEWIAPEFFFSRNDGWDRYGMMGVLGDYMLSSVSGDVLEIGAGESSIYLSAVAKKYHRRFYTCDIAPSKLLNPLSVPNYITYESLTYFEERDPTPSSLRQCVCFAGPSDQLFARVAVSPLALSFIDGDHVLDQVRRDFEHVFERTVENGFIFMHDTYPPSEEYLDENHCGNGYVLRQELERRTDLDCLTLTRGTAVGVGLTIIRKHATNRPFYQ